MSGHEAGVAGARESAMTSLGSIGRPLPLNSRQLTAPFLKQLATGLEIPICTAASLEDIRLLIDGKLGEMGRDPMNTQVVLEEGEGGGTHLSLQDAEGVFLRVEPPEPTGPEMDPVPSTVDEDLEDGGAEHELADLR